MRFSCAVLASLLAWSCASPSLAAPSKPVIVNAVTPLNQELVTVDYARDGMQTGCGLRATGSTKDDVWLNVLVNVFIQQSHSAFGMFKVVAKKIKMENGSPVLQNGKLAYESIGKIHKAWIRTESGAVPTIFKNGEASHNDGYMTSMEFTSSMTLLSAMARENFLVAFVREENGVPEVFNFNKKLSAAEAAKLTLCMGNLRQTAEQAMGQGL